MTAPIPRVSIVMPMRNAERFVEASVRSVLNQREADLELIVVDDGSTDRSAEIVRAIQDDRVRLIPGPQAGIASAVNAGLAACLGDVFIRCDSDDLLPAGHVAAQVAFLDEHAEFDAVCSAFQTVNPKGTLVSNLNTGNTAEEVTHELRGGETRTHFGTFGVRTALMRRLGGARDYFIGTEDIDLQLRIGTAGRVWYEPRIGYTYRLHHASSTHTQPSPQREFLTEQARVFARQRIETGSDDLERGTAPPPPLGHAKAMDVEGQIQGMLVHRAWKEANAGHWRGSLRTGWLAMRAKPGSAHGWVTLLKLCVLPALRLVRLKSPLPSPPSGDAG